MKNNKRFLFPLACVCVFLHPKSSRLSPTYITEKKNTRIIRSSLPLPQSAYCSPLLLSPYCYGMIAVLIHFRENNQNTNKQYHKSARHALDAAAILFLHDERNQTVTRKKVHPKNAPNFACERDALQLQP